MKITILCTPEQGDALQRAFEEGRLKVLGVIDIQPTDPKELEAAKKEWTGTEKKRRGKPKRDEVPPRK